MKKALDVTDLPTIQVEGFKNVWMNQTDEIIGMENNEGKKIIFKTEDFISFMFDKDISDPSNMTESLIQFFECKSNSTPTETTNS